jgi:hypothetical protein
MEDYRREATHKAKDRRKSRYQEAKDVQGNEYILILYVLSFYLVEKLHFSRLFS